ncbi:MAG: GIY-YIG nuclease family protein [Burkholderiales bacterium]
MSRTYYVYFVASISRVVYIGVTNNLVRRVYEHKQGLVAGFTKRYQVDRLVYFEETTDVRVAIEREKQLKTWRREKKLALIEATNPSWKDLYLDFTG